MSRLSMDLARADHPRRLGAIFEGGWHGFVADTRLEIFEGVLLQRPNLSAGGRSSGPGASRWRAGK
ncbi:hypothetical protein SBA3_550037 [Candidatus Sulfopaludibacter sp. SbA3]|nr:hypothetical protein SBA3_550037 [Candidatus Sulfopaludibacter sp. SbA3]